MKRGGVNLGKKKGGGANCPFSEINIMLSITGATRSKTNGYCRWKLFHSKSFRRNTCIQLTHRKWSDIFFNAINCKEQMIATLIEWHKLLIT
jgi:hypothetical protein